MSASAAAPDVRLVRRRLVVQIYGYQLTAPEDHHRHFAQDIALFDRNWALSTTLGAGAVEAETARWPVRVRGQGWETRTDYRILRFDDLMAKYHRRSMTHRLLAGYLGLLDFTCNRAILGFFRYNKRYACLMQFPLVFAVLGLAAGGFVGSALREPAGVVAAGVGAACAVAICLFLANRYMFLLIVLDNWAFASTLARGLEPDFVQRLAWAAGDIVRERARHDYDEILVVGHSLGAVLALYLIDRLVREPDTGRAGITLVTLGSSLLKIGLHSAARELRDVVARVTARADVRWIDYQSRIDVMSFSGSDPVTALGLRATHPPIVRAALFSRMLDPAAFRRLYFNFYRCHNQFVRAGTRRSSYDYYMFTCGPFFMTDLAATRGGACEKLSVDGALR